jgi:hypothetical protein
VPASGVMAASLAAHTEARRERAFGFGAGRGAGERDRTADLPFTRRPLCQLSYTGVDVLMLAETSAAAPIGNSPGPPWHIQWQRLQRAWFELHKS